MSADQKLRQQVLSALTDDRAALMMRQPFLALLALQLPIVPVVDDRVATACTDGQRLFVSAPRMAELDAQPRLFVLAHLVWHCALLHPWRRAERVSPNWDLAIDHEVNAILQEHLDLPPGAVLFEDRLGESAENVYQALAAAPCASDRGELADEHLGLCTGGASGRFDPEFAPYLSLRSEAIWAERVLAAAQLAARAGTPLPAAVERLMSRLRHPVLPWKELLRKFVVSTVGDQRAWLPPGRRHLHRGLYLPSRRDKLLRLAVALDTSASTHAVQHELLAELDGIVDSYGRYELLLIQGDAEVQSVQRYSNDRRLDVDSLTLRGFGGTDFRPAFSCLAEQPTPPSALLFLTDGHGSAPDAPPWFPVLWVLTADGDPPAPWGQALRLPPMPASRRGPRLERSR